MNTEISRKDFFEEVYSIVEQIPYGKVLSYSYIAKLTGHPLNARMVGRAMYCAPQERFIPCHRVVNSTGRTAPGWQEQRSLLEHEGVTFRKNGCVNMKLHLWEIEI